MSNFSAKELIKIIDDRIRKYSQNNKKLVEYTGTVIETLSDNKVLVKLAGTDTTFTFSNKTNQHLNPNDIVYVKCNGDDLNSGMVSYAFKSYVPFYAVNSVYLSTDSNFNPSAVFGGVWNSLGQVLTGIYGWKKIS